MTIRAIDAAQKVLELSDWTITNLKLQKILYIANMIYLGRHGEPLVGKYFEASMFGPIIPSLYDLLKRFGGQPITINISERPVDILDCEEFKTLTEVWNSLGNKEDWKLIKIIHSPGSAWDKRYKTEVNVVLTDEDILEEYNNIMTMP